MYLLFLNRVKKQGTANLWGVFMDFVKDDVKHVNNTKPVT